MNIPFTMIPNDLITSPHLNAFDKVVFMVIASYQPSFPSYSTIARLSGVSRRMVNKCLRNLEEHKMIVRFKKGSRIFYLTLGRKEKPEGEQVEFWTQAPKKLSTLDLDRGMGCTDLDQTGAPGAPLETPTSAPGAPILVHRVHCNKIKKQERGGIFSNFFGEKKEETEDERKSFLRMQLRQIQEADRRSHLFEAMGFKISSALYPGCRCMGGKCFKPPLQAKLRTLRIV